MRNEVMWAIRDASGLTSKEKVFLFVVESRGEMFTDWQDSARDMGLSKRGYYDSRASLLAKGLLTSTRRMDSTTVYKVNADAFPYGESAPVQDTDDSRSGNEDSRMGNDHSHSGNDHSRSDESKKNSKKNTKKNTKNNIEEEQGSEPLRASSPVETDPRGEAEGSGVDFDFGPSSSPSNKPVSPEVENTADSHSGNGWDTDHQFRLNKIRGWAFWMEDGDDERISSMLYERELEVNARNVKRMQDELEAV